MTRSDGRLRACALPLLLMAITACGGSDPAPSQETRLVVFAAASLREAFTVIGQDFERSHAGVELTFNFAGTQELRTQLLQGAAVDVFASADLRHMQELVQAKRTVDPATFARNEPVVVVAKEHMATLRAFSDLPMAKRIVIGTPEVPIGRYTLQLLDRATDKLGRTFREAVEARVVSRELNVKQVLAKVALGEADAGIVYRTDAMAAKDRVGLVAIPPELNVLAEYSIAVTSDATHPRLAGEWVQLVLASPGQQALSSAGFLAAASGL